MKTWCAIGIDPGVEGAVAWLTDLGTPANGFLLNTSDATETARLLRELEAMFRSYNLVAGVEKVHSMPKQGVASAFKFGTAFATPRAILASLGVSQVLVRPADWYALAFANRRKPKDKKARKAAILSAARERWPYVPLARQKDGAIAEALWMALWVAQSEGWLGSSSTLEEDHGAGELIHTVG